MKHIVPPLLALLLALALLAGASPLTVFAAGDAGETVVWDFDGEEDTYTILGTFTVGTQTVDSAFCGYLFTAQEAGLYQLRVTMDGKDVEDEIWFGISNDLADGKASEIKPYDALSATPDGEEWEYFSSFAAGETQLIAFDDVPDGGSLTATLTYCGAVTGLTPYRPADAYVIDATIWQYEQEEGESPEIDVDLPFAVTLSQGRTCYTYPKITGTLTAGDVTLLAEFGGIESEFTLHCVQISDVIRAMAFPADYDATVIEYFNGDAILKNDFPTALTVTFSDGSVESFDVEMGEWFFGNFYYADIVTPEGIALTIYVDAYYDDESEEYVLEASIGETSLTKLTCPVEEADRSENVKYFFSSLSYAFNATMRNLPANFAYGYGLFGVFDDMITMFRYMREQIGSFLAYLF